MPSVKKKPIEAMVSPAKPTLMCMTVTPMHADGRIDEAGFRKHLQRIIKAGHGIYLGSGGSGEGHALDLDELQRVYEIGVEEAKGKVPIYCNPPESRSAREMLAKAKRGIEAGVDVGQLYQMDAGHGRQPVLAEQEGYFRDLLEEIDHPVALSIHMAVGYMAPPSLTAKLCNDYPQVRVVNLAAGPTMSYLTQLQDQLKRNNIKIYMGLHTLLDGLLCGAWGAQITEPNQVPNICKQIMVNWDKGDYPKAIEAYRNMLRVAEIIGYGRRVSADGPKGALEALGLPVGPPRPPRVKVDPATIERMRAAFKAMGVFKLEGIPIPK